MLNKIFNLLFSFNWTCIKLFSYTVPAHICECQRNAILSGWCYKSNYTKKRKSIDSTNKSRRTNVGPTWYLKENDWLCYGRWTYIDPTVGYLVGPISKNDRGSTSTNTNVDPTNNCYLGCTLDVLLM